VEAQTDHLPLLSEANAAFIQRFTSMNVAGRDAQNRPALARVLGIHCTEPGAPQNSSMPGSRMPALRACSQRLAKCAVLMVPPS